jgi:hypothetical protein
LYQRLLSSELRLFGQEAIDDESREAMPGEYRNLRTGAFKVENS